MPAAVVTGIPASDTSHESPVEIPDDPQPMSPTLLETPTEPDMITRRASTMSTIPASEEEIAGMAAPRLNYKLSCLYLHHLRYQNI